MKRSKVTDYAALIVLASGADRDKMPHYAAFYLGLHGLQVSRLRKKSF